MHGVSQASLLAQPIEQSELLADMVPRAELLRICGEIASKAEYVQPGLTFPGQEQLQHVQVKLK